MRNTTLAFILLVVCAAAQTSDADDPSPDVSTKEVSFSLEVLPLLSDRCFHCHGPDESQREADLRLDQRESAIESGAISPGSPQTSELLRRVQSKDAGEQMPPADSHRKPLTSAEMETLTRWIEQGAPWGRHWAFEPPTKSTPPTKGDTAIDAFVRARLAHRAHQSGDARLQPSPRADLHTLARRVAFDLTGLPPTPEQLAELAAQAEHFRRLGENESDANLRPGWTPGEFEAYRQFVDQLLESPHYGERMAMWWLDLARYSDTDGYQQDATRTNWPWRDWVVSAFNEDMPYDQFTIEQFAGDLLPEATVDQQLATCFHRNHMTNGEGGRDPEESRVDYVIDRVNTTGSVWLGLTLGCCQCHSHKFDPITQQEYYQLFAFFNSIDEDGKAGGGAKPYLKTRSSNAARAIEEAEQIVAVRKAAEQTAKTGAEQEFTGWLEALARKLQDDRQPFDPWQILTADFVTQLASVEGTELKQEDGGHIRATGPNPVQDDYRIFARSPLSRITGLRLEVLPDERNTDGKLSRGANGEFILTDVKLQVRRRGDSQLRDIDISTAVADVEKKAAGRNYGNVKDTLDDDPRNGWTTETHDSKQKHVAVFGLAEPLWLDEDEELVFVMLHRSTQGDANIGCFQLSVTNQPGKAVRSLSPMPVELLAEALRKNSQLEELEPKLRSQLLEQFLADHSDYQQVKGQLDAANRQLAEVKKAGGELKVMVLKERQQPRDTHVLKRGVWDQHGDQVTRGVPQAVLAWSKDQTQTRLDLARWLVDDENPLTARVTVNHLWQLCFGAGLVRTPEDFGLQGELPTHPQLLDWLAVELVEHGWSFKHLLKTIVTSDTYCQSSRSTQQSRELDPDNRWLARGARFRLPSWMIRDAALQSSGLLNPAIGGPPTMPYQPAGVWRENFMGRFIYRPSQGAAQHRRTLYAFWRRAAAPTFLFDSAQRRVCEVRMRRTNTPLHALTLLNDETMLEASRAVARQVLSDKDDPLGAMFSRILSRPPSDVERAVLNQQRERISERYQSASEAAKAFLRFGQPERQASEQPVELATLTVLASMIYNLDEAISHE